VAGLACCQKRRQYDIILQVRDGPSREGVSERGASTLAEEPLNQSGEAGKGSDHVVPGLTWKDGPKPLASRQGVFCMSEKVIMSTEEIRRALTRIAHEIIERNHGCDGLVLVGVHTRGVPLANRIAASVKAIEEVDILVGKLDIGPYRDDLDLLVTPPKSHPSEMPGDVSGKRMVIVDDVLYTGRSIRAAMDALIDMGRPRHIQLAVLVDRGHRELPIRPDYVGKNVPTSKDEAIEVRLRETDGKDEVVIISRGATVGMAKETATSAVSRRRGEQDGSG